MAAPERIRISVVYALPDRQVSVTLAVAPGTTVAAAVEHSALVRRFPEIAALPPHYAIFSRVVNASARVAEGDRIEILRPLLIDPKENRRRTADRARKAARH
jgi:putative ubiquitin-RnfH superfamily antitoxin RatB of RatAB toxin-antitoxin module